MRALHGAKQLVAASAPPLTAVRPAGCAPVQAGVLRLHVRRSRDLPSAPHTGPARTDEASASRYACTAAWQGAPCWAALHRRARQRRLQTRVCYLYATAA